MGITRFAPLAMMVAIAGCAIDTGPPISWGRPDVSFNDYRLDSVECGVQGAYSDVSDREEVTDTVAAVRSQDRAYDKARIRGQTGASNPMDEFIDAQREIQSTQRSRIDPNVASLQGVLVGEVEQCLIERGYTPFVLTDPQQKHLRNLRKGTQARFDYLHSLAEDEAVLTSQAVGPTPEAQ